MGTFKQTNAFAMQSGLLFSIWWILGFILLINSFNYPFFQHLLFVNLILTPLLGGFLTYYFRKQTGDIFLTFGKAYTFSLLLYFYASVILALAGFIYFSYLDNGAFWDSYVLYLQSDEIQTHINTPEYQELIQNAFNTTNLEEIIDKVKLIKPIEIAASIINLNFTMGLFLSIPTAIFCKKTRL